MRPLKEHNREKLKQWKNGKNTIEVWRGRDDKQKPIHGISYLGWLQTTGLQVGRSAGASLYQVP
jgi:hypothetical protein